MLHIIYPILPSREAFIVYLSLNPIGTCLLIEGKFCMDRLIFIDYVLVLFSYCLGILSLNEEKGLKRKGLHWGDTLGVHPWKDVDHSIRSIASVRSTYLSWVHDYLQLWKHASFWGDICWSRCQRIKGKVMAFHSRCSLV